MHLASVRAATAAVVALWAACAVPNHVFAQQVMPPVTAYAGPIAWDPGLGAGPGGGNWASGVNFPTENPGAGGNQPPLVQCADWEELHPKPSFCGGPPGPVSVNGCGPGGWLSFIGALYPDGPFGNACNVHDACYSMPGADRSACDAGLNANMGQVCDNYFGCIMDLETHQFQCNGTPAQLQACHDDRAGVMSDLNSWWAGPTIAARFNTVQQEAACRLWFNARANESNCPPP
jgi:hypothetical protein